MAQQPFLPRMARQPIEIHCIQEFGKTDCNAVELNPAIFQPKTNVRNYRASIKRSRSQKTNPVTIIVRS